jgi:RimJ/RimL family protein N-acetyltransferase
MTANSVSRDGLNDWPELSTERLLLRGWSPQDRVALRAINADPRVMEFLGDPLTSDQTGMLVDRIEAKFVAQGFGFWAVEIPGVAPLIGFVGLNVPNFDAPFMPAVEIGWRLGADYWGQGYASEAALAAMQFGFNIAELHEIVAFTNERNIRSRRVMERIGMTHDPRDDFEHPSEPLGSPLRPHVLYRATRPMVGRDPAAGRER